MILFSVLGSLRVQSSNGKSGQVQNFVPRGPKVRTVLALLLSRPNQVVGRSTIAEELWDLTPPSTSDNTIRTHVYHLRRMLTAGNPAPLPAEALVTQPNGYSLHIAPEQLDSIVFTQAVDRGGMLLRQGKLDAAAESLDRAINLWRGPALADITLGPVLSRHATHLEELRLRALELRVETQMRLGNHRELVAELRELVAANPLHEWFHARLIDALHRSNRRGEALAAFRALRTALDQELGLEPSEELRRLQHDILTARPAC